MEISHWNPLLCTINIFWSKNWGLYLRNKRLKTLRDCFSGNFKPFSFYPLLTFLLSVIPFLLSFSPSFLPSLSLLSYPSSFSPLPLSSMISFFPLNQPSLRGPHVLLTATCKKDPLTNENVFLKWWPQRILHDFFQVLTSLLARHWFSYTLYSKCVKLPLFFSLRKSCMFICQGLSK
jgi:hypothetical protein